MKHNFRFIWLDPEDDRNEGDRWEVLEVRDCENCPYLIANIRNTWTGEEGTAVIEEDNFGWEVIEYHPKEEA